MLNPLIVIILGIVLILFQIYVEITAETDDRYLSKKTTDQIIKELEEKRNQQGRLSLWDWHNLKSRVYIKERIILKIGVVILTIGLILKVIF